MILRALISIFAATMLTSTAIAQSSQTQLPVSTEWDMLSPKQLACMEQALKQNGKADIGALVGRGMRPSHPDLKVFMSECDPQRGAGSSQPSESKTDAFVLWFSTDILSKPAFSSAFGQCKAIITQYQDGILERVRSRAATLDSRSKQQELLNAAETLAQRRSDVAKVACIKQFISALRVSGSSTGYYADELSAANGKLLSPRFDLKDAAKTKLDDLTAEGMMRLATLAALGNLNQSTVQSEISTIGMSGAGYLSCLLTNDWVSWFSSEPFCHGPVLELSLNQSVKSVKLP